MIRKGAIVCVCLFWLLSGVTLYAKTGTLMDMVGVNGYALGSATTAGLSDSSSFDKNPARLSLSSHSYFYSGYSSFFGDLVKGSVLGGITPYTSRLTFGFSVPMRWITGIEKVDEVSSVGVVTGSFSDIEVQPNVSLAWKVSSFMALGAGVDMTYHTVYNETATQMSGSVGAFFSFETTSVGVSLTQLPILKKSWSTGLKESFPVVARAGVSQIIDQGLEIIADAALDGDGHYQLNAGLNVTLSPLMDVQVGGYDIGDTTQLRVGTRLTLGALRLSYAYAQHDTLGIVHKVGIGLATL